MREALQAEVLVTAVGKDKAGELPGLSFEALSDASGGIADTDVPFVDDAESVSLPDQLDWSTKSVRRRVSLTPCS